MDPPLSFERNAALVISFPTEEDQDEEKEEGNIRVSSSSSAIITTTMSFASRVR